MKVQGMRRLLSVLTLLLGCFSQLTVGLSKSKTSRPNVLLITIDTLRADHVGCYGYSAAETPRIDRLAQEGYLFENAFTSAPVTAPSHASILTGTYPTYHGVRDNGNYILDSYNVTLAEILRGEGYLTAAFVGSFVLERRFGLCQGFETYNDDFSGGTSHVKSKDHTWVGHTFENFERNAKLVNKAALPWIEARAQAPFFLWVHYFDPHKEYAPPEPWASRYSDCPYDGEIACVDHHLGILLDALSNTGMRDETLIVLVSDHGEGLGQHEGAHGFTLFDPLIRVLLIVVPPGGLSECKRVQREVRTIDILPTILDYLDLDTSGVVHGSTLKSYVESDDPRKPGHGPPVYCETHRFQRPYKGGILRGLRNPSWKLVVSEQKGELSLYNLQQDPQEAQDLFSDETTVAREMERRMRSIIRASSKDGEEVEEEITMDDTTVNKLKALGYIQ